MRSKDRAIHVTKAINLGHMPAFVSFMHRHLEKEAQPVEAKGEHAEFQVPVDLLKLTVDDASLVREVESVTLTYRSRS